MLHGKWGYCKIISSTRLVCQIAKKSYNFYRLFPSISEDSTVQIPSLPAINHTPTKAANSTHRRFDFGGKSVSPAAKRRSYARRKNKHGRKVEKTQTHREGCRPTNQPAGRTVREWVSQTRPKPNKWTASAAARSIPASSENPDARKTDVRKRKHAQYTRIKSIVRGREEGVCCCARVPRSDRAPPNPCATPTGVCAHINISNPTCARLTAIFNYTPLKQLPT